MQIIALLGVLALAAYWWMGGLRGIDQLFNPAETLSHYDMVEPNVMGPARSAKDDVTGTSSCAEARHEPRQGCASATAAGAAVLRR
jgi:hypothetical protein